jgi:hypothetical protein
MEGKKTLSGGVSLLLSFLLLFATSCTEKGFQDPRYTQDGFHVYGDIKDISYFNVYDPHAYIGLGRNSLIIVLKNDLYYGCVQADINGKFSFSLMPGVYDFVVWTYDLYADTIRNIKIKRDTTLHLVLVFKFRIEEGRGLVLYYDD